MPGIFNRAIFNDPIFNTALVQGGTSSKWKKKHKRPKDTKFIRYSDFEAREAYEASLLVQPVPMVDVPLEGNVVAVEDDDDDEIILAALKAMIH
jgi:hypothetical protein